MASHTSVPALNQRRAFRFTAIIVTSISVASGFLVVAVFSSALGTAAFGKGPTATLEEAIVFSSAALLLSVAGTEVPIVPGVVAVCLLAVLVVLGRLLIGPDEWLSRIVNPAAPWTIACATSVVLIRRIAQWRRGMRGGLNN